MVKGETNRLEHSAPEHFGVPGHAETLRDQGQEAEGATNGPGRPTAKHKEQTKSRPASRRSLWLMESKNSENRNSGTVYNHSSGVSAQSRKLPSNGPKAALMLTLGTDRSVTWRGAQSGRRAVPAASSRRPLPFQDVSVSDGQTAPTRAG